MKQQWAAQELLDHWTLSSDERILVNSYHTDSNKLGCALLLKYFQREGKFPQRKQDIPRVIIEHLAQQLQIKTSAFDSYRWERGTIDRHRAQIRKFLKVRTGTVADANEILAWLVAQTQVIETHNIDRLKEVVYDRYEELKIEPPQPGRVERIIRSAIRIADEQFYTATMARLQPETREKLEALLTTDDNAAENTSALFTLKNEAGAATLDSVLTEVAKLERIRSISLPGDLFAGVSRKRLLWCRQRIAVEDLHEVRRHPNDVRYSLSSII